MPQTIKSLLIAQQQSKHARSASSVPQLHPMKHVLKNSTSSRCGSHPTAPLETFSAVLSSVSQLSSKTFPNAFQAGPNQLLSEDTLSVTSTAPRTSAPRKQEPSLWLSPQPMEASPQLSRFTSLPDQVLCSVCTTRTNLFMNSLTALSDLPSRENSHFTCQLKTPSSRSMTVASRISLRKFTNQPTRRNLRHLRFGMNIVSSMIWLLMLSNQMVASYGLARTTMVTSNQILSLKATVPSVSWHPSCWPQMVQSRQKLLTVPSLVTTACTRRAVRPPLTQLLQSLLGLVVSSTVQSWTTTPSLRTGARPLNVSSSSQLRTVKWPRTWQSACTEQTMLPDQPTLTLSSSWTRLPPTSTRLWANEKVRYEVKIIYYFGQLLRNKGTWIFPDIFGRLCPTNPASICV